MRTALTKGKAKAKQEYTHYIRLINPRERPKPIDVARPPQKDHTMSVATWDSNEFNSVTANSLSQWEDELDERFQTRSRLGHARWLEHLCAVWQKPKSTANST
jgi:hypothetical protein